MAHRNREMILTTQDVGIDDLVMVVDTPTQTLVLTDVRVPKDRQTELARQLLRPREFARFTALREQVALA